MKLLKFCRDDAPLMIVGNISQKTLKHVIDGLNISIDDNGDKVASIMIHSYGGNAESTLQIMEYLHSLKRSITLNTFAAGPVMSGGFYLYMMGNNRYAEKHVEFMHHTCRGMSFNTAYSAEEDAKYMRYLDRALNELIDVPLTNSEKAKFDRGEDLTWRYREAKSKGIITC